MRERRPLVQSTMATFVPYNETGNSSAEVDENLSNFTDGEYMTTESYFDAFTTEESLETTEDPFSVSGGYLHCRKIPFAILTRIPSDFEREMTAFTLYTILFIYLLPCRYFHYRI